jgi:hypothetical protein
LEAVQVKRDDGSTKRRQGTTGCLLYTKTAIEFGK